jgi:hypothetical protein
MKKPFSRSEIFARIQKLLDENGVPRRRLDTELDAAPPPEAVQGQSAAAPPPPPPPSPRSQVEAIIAAQPVVSSESVPAAATPSADPDALPFPRINQSIPEASSSLPYSLPEPPPFRPQEQFVAPVPAPVASAPTEPVVEIRASVPAASEVSMDQKGLLTQIIKWATLALSRPEALETLRPLMMQLADQIGEKEKKNAAPDASVPEAQPLSIM